MRAITINEIIFALYDDNLWKHCEEDTITINYQRFKVSMLRKDMITTNTTMRMKWAALKVNPVCVEYSDTEDWVKLNRDAVEKIVKGASQ